MLYTLITLAVVSAALFILSFFMNDKFQQTEDQLEEFSISTIQDIYRLKKKVKILEEELLTEDINTEWENGSDRSASPSPYLTEAVKKLHLSGMDPKMIAAKTSISEYDVRSLLTNQTGPDEGARK